MRLRSDNYVYTYNQYNVTDVMSIYKKWKWNYRHQDL